MGEVGGGEVRSAFQDHHLGAPSAPRDLAGVVADDGLTLRWVPATDASGQLGNVTLYVNGESAPSEMPMNLSALTA